MEKEERKKKRTIPRWTAILFLIVLGIFSLFLLSQILTFIFTTDFNLDTTSAFGGALGYIFMSWLLVWAIKNVIKRMKLRDKN
jgi:hypothetical protein